MDAQIKAFLSRRWRRPFLKNRIFTARKHIFRFKEMLQVLKNNTAPSSLISFEYNDANELK